MRLINTRTLLLHEFTSNPPPYAILSHTWGRDEVSYHRFRYNPDSSRSTAGFAKIESASVNAQQHGLDYLWVDTCCIDKSSSAELGEAINSMFKWYQRAAVCYALLEDYNHADAPGKPQESMDGAVGVGFGHCRWFSRGWTLQELIAPRNVEFYDRGWNKVAEKEKNSGELQAITGIDASVLEGGPLDQVTIGRRMSWAVGRQTTREEDTAYSLLGLFDVNMPLVYGEGPKAFTRLQEEILRHSDDHTLFAWRASSCPRAENPRRGLLASSPIDFWNFTESSHQFRKSMSDPLPVDNLIRVWDSRTPQSPITTTNKGIRIAGQMQDLRGQWAPGELIIFVLNCSFGGDPGRAVGIYLRRQDEDRYARVRVAELADVRPHGRHILNRTFHGLRRVEDVKGHHYDEPWTTSYRIRMEKLAKRESVEASRRVKDFYSHAFYMGWKSLKTRTPFRQYSVCGLLIADTHGLRFFRFYSDEQQPDVVLKTHTNFKAAIMLQTEGSEDMILILLGTRKRDSGKLSHWFDVVLLSASDLDADPTLLSTIVSNINCEQEPPQWATIKLDGGTLGISITTKPTQIEELPMQSIIVTGPWPASTLVFVRMILLKLGKICLGMVPIGGILFACIETMGTEDVRSYVATFPPWFSRLSEEAK